MKTKMDTIKREIQLLSEMGLTVLQAKLFMQIIMKGKQKATTLSKVINIDKSNTYQALNQLEKMGLVTKILGRPTLYEAIPIEEGITTLLEYKKEQYYNAREKAENLLQLIPTKKASQKNEVGEFKIRKYVKDTELKKIKLVCDSSNQTIDLLLNRRTFLTGMVENIDPHLTAIKRGIKYRVITEKKGGEQIHSSIQKLIMEPNFQIRYISHTPDAEICLVDKSNASISLLPGCGIGERPNLTTSNLGCVKIFQKFFEIIWNQLEELKLEKISV